MLTLWQRLQAVEAELSKAQRVYTAARGKAKDAARLRLLAAMDDHAAIARLVCIPADGRS